MNNNPICLNDPLGLDPKKGKNGKTSNDGEKQKSPSKIKEVFTRAYRYVENRFYHYTGQQYKNDAYADADKRGISRKDVVFGKDKETGQGYADVRNKEKVNGVATVNSHRFWSGGKKKESIDPRNVANYWGKEYSKPKSTEFTVDGTGNRKSYWQQFKYQFLTDHGGGIVTTTNDENASANGSSGRKGKGSVQYVNIDDFAGAAGGVRNTATGGWAKNIVEALDGIADAYDMSQSIISYKQTADAAENGGIHHVEYKTTPIYKKGSDATGIYGPGDTTDAIIHYNNGEKTRLIWHGGGRNQHIED